MTEQDFRNVLRCFILSIIYIFWTAFVHCHNFIPNDEYYISSILIVLWWLVSVIGGLFILGIVYLFFENWFVSFMNK